MPTILPEPTSVNILSDDTRLSDVFPYSFEDKQRFEDSTFSGTESNFIYGRLILDSLCSNPSDDNPDALDIKGAILNTSIPALCTGISVDFELDYKTPIVFSSCIKTEGEGEEKRQISSFRALNGVSYGSEMSVAFVFGLSGALYNEPECDKYHFRWVFINQSCRASTNLTDYAQDSGKNICQEFYIDADRWVTVYDDKGVQQGSVADMNEQGIVPGEDWKFVPDNNRHIVEMYYNDILFDGQHPENVVWRCGDTDEERHDYKIDQNSWGVNSSGILSCRCQNDESADTRDISLQPFDLSCGNNFDETNLSGGSTIDGRYYRHEIYLFGWKEYANITKENIDIGIHPVKMKLHGARIFWDKEIKPISHIIPAAISASSFDPLKACYYDAMVQNMVPLELRDKSKSRFYDIGEIQTDSTEQNDEKYCINIDRDDWDKAIAGATTRRPTYNFVDWSANEGIRGLPFSVLPGGYDGNAITANYLDKNLVFSLEAVGDEIVDTVNGEPAVTLTSNDFPEDRFIYKGGYKVNGGEEVHFPSTVSVETYLGHYENCVSMDGMMDFIVNPVYLKTPRPTMGESFTFMGWYRFTDYGDGTYIPQEGNTLKYESQCSNVNNSNLSILGGQLSSLRYNSTGSSRHYDYLSSIQQIKNDWETKRITYNTDKGSFGGWANFSLMSGKFKWVKMDDPDNPGYFTDLGMDNLLGIGLDTNDGYSGNKPPHNWRRYDVRGNVNFTIYNYTTKKYDAVSSFMDEEFNEDGSSGQLVVDRMSGNIDNEENLGRIADNISNIKDNWTFFAISFDAGGYGGYYGQRRDADNETHERGYRMGYIRNERGTYLHTNPSLSCLSTSYTLCRYPVYPFFSTGKEYDFVPWTIIGNEAQIYYVKNNLIVDVTGNFSERVPPYHFKYIRMFDRAFKKDELDKIYETEKKMFYQSQNE